MWPLIFTVSLSLIYSLVAGHTDNFILVKHLADKAHVQLDLTGKQSYAIYEQCYRKNLFQMSLPYNYHMRLINGRVKCKDDSNCDFVGYAFDIRKVHNEWSAFTGATITQVLREEPWMSNHYYDRQLKSYAKLPKTNHYIWAGPTKDLTHRQIHNIGMHKTLEQHLYADRRWFCTLQLSWYNNCYLSRWGVVQKLSNVQLFLQQLPSFRLRPLQRNKTIAKYWQALKDQSLIWHPRWFILPGWVRQLSNSLLLLEGTLAQDLGAITDLQRHLRILAESHWAVTTQDKGGSGVYIWQKPLQSLIRSSSSFVLVNNLLVPWRLSR